MKEYKCYSCDYCDFESDDEYIMRNHEASHFGLTIVEMVKIKGLKDDIVYGESCINDDELSDFFIEEYTKTIKNLKKQYHKFLFDHNLSDEDGNNI